MALVPALLLITGITLHLALANKCHLLASIILEPTTSVSIRELSSVTVSPNMSPGLWRRITTRLLDDARAPLVLPYYLDKHCSLTCPPNTVVGEFPALDRLPL